MLPAHQGRPRPPRLPRRLGTRPDSARHRTTHARRDAHQAASCWDPLARPAADAPAGQHHDDDDVVVLSEGEKDEEKVEEEKESGQ